MQSSAFEALRTHLERHVPWGAHMTLTLEHDGAPCVIDSTGPAYKCSCPSRKFPCKHALGLLFLIVR